MKYCVIKNTTRPINNNESIEILIKDALSAGFTESEVEILTEEEYLARKSLEPQQPQQPMPEERLTLLEDTVLALMME